MPISKDTQTSGRIKSIDVVRGMAVVQMIFWQIFDFFSKIDIYKDFPHLVKTMNAPPHFSVLVIFLSMSGASIYISISKKMKKGKSRIEILKNIIRRYGGFIVISLFFTTIVFDFCTFFRWEEAIQGIGLAAIFASLIILFTYEENLERDKFLNRMNSTVIFLMVLLIILQPLVVKNMWSFTQDYMFCNTDMNIEQLPTSFLINLSFRGFFSIRGLLPMVLVGVVLGQVIVSGRLKNNNKIIFLFGLVLMVSTIFIHLHSKNNELLNDFVIDFYARSYSSMMLEIGILFTLFSSVEFVLNKKNWFLLRKILNLFVPFGMITLISYLGHFLFVYKPLQIMSLYTDINLLNNMNPLQSVLLSLALVVIFYQVTLRCIRKH